MKKNDKIYIKLKDLQFSSTDKFLNIKELKIKTNSNIDLLNTLINLLNNFKTKEKSMRRREKDISRLQGILKDKGIPPMIPQTEDGLKDVIKGWGCNFMSMIWLNLYRNNCDTSEVTVEDVNTLHDICTASGSLENNCYVNYDAVSRDVAEYFGITPIAYDEDKVPITDLEKVANYEHEEETLLKYSTNYSAGQHYMIGNSEMTFYDPDPSLTMVSKIKIYFFK